MRFLRFSFLVSLSALALRAPASGGGGESAPATKVPKDQKEFVEKTSKMNSLINKISEAEKQFKELVHHKEVAKTTAEKQTIIHQMVEVSGQRNKDVEAYNKLKSDLSLRYPDQGEKLDRSYQTQTKRSVEELEGVAGLDELLTRTKKMIEKKFAPFMADEPKVKGSRKLANDPAGGEPVRLRLEK